MRVSGRLTKEGTVSMMDKFFDGGAFLGGAVGGMNQITETMTGKSIVELILSDDAKDTLKANVKNQTDNLNVNARG